MRCVPVIWENVLYTQNVSVRRMKNFLRASKVKVFAKILHKMTKDSEAWQSYLRDMNFKNLLEIHYSFNKKCFVGCTDIIQNALHFPDLGECF